MNIMKNKTIKFKILFSLIIFSVFIIFLLWETQFFLTGFLYEKYQIRDMNKIAYEIRDADSTRLNEFLNGVVYNNAVCIEFVDFVGNKTLYNVHSTGCLLGKSKKELSKYKTQLINSEKDMEAIKLINSDYESNALLYGIRVDTGYVYVFTMLSNVNKNYLLINGQLTYIALVIILLSIFISYFLSYKFSEPIVNITKKSNEVAKGNYNVVFEKNGIKEIDELADTLNYLESEVRKTDQYRRDLMANVSHDLKTPLTMIKAYAEMVRDITYKDKEKMESNLNTIIDETDRLNTLVNDILLLSKLESNVTEIKVEKYDLVKEIKTIIGRYSIFNETEGYEIEYDGIDEAFVKADREQLNQVVYNLINNAINYTENKKVIVKVVELKKEYEISFIDFGKGIKKEEIELIWDRYYKSEKKHRRNVIGSGLGLSIVKNIFESHKLEYGVKSKEKEGSTFYFKIKKVVNKK